MPGQRYWVERTIENGKSHAGLADYKIRIWTGCQSAKRENGDVSVFIYVRNKINTAKLMRASGLLTL